MYKIENMSFNHRMHVSVTDDLDLLRGQSNSRSTGMDGYLLKV